MDQPGDAGISLCRRVPWRRDFGLGLDFCWQGGRDWLAAVVPRAATDCGSERAEPDVGRSKRHNDTG